MNSRRVPANTSRMVEGAVSDAKRDARLAIGSTANTWEATVYKGAKEPVACATCSKRGTHMRLIASGEIECSHIACPNRRRYTAQPSDRPTGEDE